jgi:hypothetical protein
MNHQMSGTQKFILAFTGLIVLGIGLSRISVAQQQQPEHQKPGQGTYSLLKANEIQLVDSKGTVRLILQAEQNDSWNGHAFQAVSNGPSILVLRGDGFAGCEINNSALYMWDIPEFTPNARSFGHTKIALEVMEGATFHERPARLRLSDDGTSGVILQARKPTKLPYLLPSKGKNLRIISADGIEVIKGTDKR